MEMFRLVEVTRLMEVPCLKKYPVSGNATLGKKYFHQGIQQVTCEKQHGATHVHSCKNEVAIERYCS